MDGTPTDIVFDLNQDEQEVLHWIGLPYVRDGERQWFDLAACSDEKPVIPATRGHRLEPREEKLLAQPWL